MKIVNIEKVGKRNVFDITVADNHQYVLENGVITHNTGVYLSADNIYILGRQQEKEGTDVVGYNFIINVEKSRHVREKSKIPITVKYEGGLSSWSGLIDMALESGHVVKPSNGWYSRVNTATGEVEEKKYRLKDTDTKDFWNKILLDKTFQDWIKSNYQVSHGNILASDKDIEQTFAEIGDDDEEL